MSITHTFVGNVATAPDLKMVNNDSTAVCMFRIGVDDRYRDSTGTWTSRPTQFYNVNGWRELATAMKEQLNVGDKVIVVGELRREEWEQDGEKRGRNYIEAQHIAKTLVRPKRQQAAGQPQGAPSAPVWGEE